VVPSSGRERKGRRALFFGTTTTPPSGGEEGQPDSGRVSSEVCCHWGVAATFMEGKLAEGGGWVGYAWRRSWRRVDVGGTFDKLSSSFVYPIHIDLIDIIQILHNAQVGEFGGIDAPLSRSRAASFSTSSAQTQQQSRAKKQHLIKIFKHSNFIGTNVSNSPGGSRCIDDALTKWCIDAMRVIRDQLYRVLPASQGAKELPYVEHWPRERSHFRGENCSNDDNDLPSWAKYASSTSANDAAEISQASIAAATAAGVSHESSVVIADLGKMADEVSAILQIIEVLLEQQRARRLDWLRPPSRLRRNWYLVAVGVPVGAVIIYKLTKEHGWLFLLNTLFTKTMDICQDHVFGPLNSIYKELFTKSGRIDVTDRKARVDAIESLKRMLRSWLEESFPTMPKEEMTERADKMDISLIEEKMEESIKHLYELNSVVRMSLIEMQFIKKVRIG
jgi:hypothetical protein